MSAVRHMAGHPSRHTVRAGRLRLVRFAGARVFTYALGFGRGVRRAGVAGPKGY